MEATGASQITVVTDGPIDPASLDPSAFALVYLAYDTDETTDAVTAIVAEGDPTRLDFALSGSGGSWPLGRTLRCAGGSGPSFPPGWSWPF